MLNYFDYILESSQEDIDDVDVIYNEYEMTINEFDSYVQEGVGAKILLGIGFAALIGLFISAIIKLVSNKSEKSASVAVARAKYLSKLAKQYGVEQVVFDAEHKKGWMSDLNMRAFQIILQESYSAEDTMREEIEYLENLDEKNIRNVDIGKKLYEMWNKNEAKVKRFSSADLKALKGKTLDDFDIFAKGGKYVPERMSGKGSYGWGETGTKDISLIDDRLDALSQFIKEFKTIGKDLQDLQKRAASLEKSKPTLMSLAEGNMDKEMISEVIEYVNEANRIMTESADAIRDAIKIQISENKKKIDKSSDDDSTGKNRVNVNDLMNGKEDFDDFMSNPNSQMVFK